ncbi:TPA: hypothetical protein ACKOR7_001923 [Clostridioides difficile]
MYFEIDIIKNKNIINQIIECCGGTTRRLEDWLKEMENRNKEKKKKEQKQHILELINKKENQELENKSIEELKSMINSLE